MASHSCSSDLVPCLCYFSKSEISLVEITKFVKLIYLLIKCLGIFIGYFFGFCVF